MEPGETLSEVAAEHGLALSRLFALNPNLSPLADETGKPVVVAWR